MRRRCGQLTAPSPFSRLCTKGPNIFCLLRAQTYVTTAEAAAAEQEVLEECIQFVCARYPSRFHYHAVEGAGEWRSSPAAGPKNVKRFPFFTLPFSSLFPLFSTLSRLLVRSDRDADPRLPA